MLNTRRTLAVILFLATPISIFAQGSPPSANQGAANQGTPATTTAPPADSGKLENNPLVRLQSRVQDLEKRPRDLLADGFMWLAFAVAAASFANAWSKNAEAERSARVEAADREARKSLMLAILQIAKTEDKPDQKLEEFTARLEKVAATIGDVTRRSEEAVRTIDAGAIAATQQTKPKDKQ